MRNRSYISTCSIDVIEAAVKSSDTFLEVAQKLGYTNKGGAYRTLRKRIEENNIDYSHMKHIGRKKIAKVTHRITSKEALTLNSSFSQSTIRAIISRENLLEYKCSICGLEPVWNGKSLTLTLDHINGNNKDNRLENLRYVCPNCDRQLETFGAKNLQRYYKTPVISRTKWGKNSQRYVCKECGKKVWKQNTFCKECLKKYNRRNFPSIELMHEAIIKSPSLVQLGRYFGISDNAARKRLKYYNIPEFSKGYQQYRRNLIIGK